MSSMNDDCVVREVKLRNGHPGPVLVDFEHGSLNKNDAAKLKCGLFMPNGSSTHKVGAVVEDGDVLYQGDLLNDDKDVCRTFLAVRNKSSNKMRIYETSRVLLSPFIMATGSETTSDALDKKQATYNLSHAFGSKKAKRIADQRARMEVNVDTVKDKLSSTVNNVDVKESDLVAAQDDSLSKLLPPCNREASTPADVYPISGLLKKKELESLESFYSKATEDEELDISHMSPYYQNMKKKIPTSNVQKSALLLYAESLVQFCNLHPKHIAQRGAVFCPFSDLVNKRISKDFTTVQGNVVVRSQFLTDKAVMYIIILSLHIGGFQLDLNLLAESIKFVDTKRIKMLARIIGTVESKSTNATKSHVLLKVPLPPPQSLIVKSRKSKR